jgi:lactaldehyde dehydrogenase/glycolaldehyde dehydrogenase
MTQHRNFIDGRFVEASASSGIDVRNPANGNVFASVPAASDADVTLAVEAAKSAQKSWRKLPAIQRGDVLRRLADAIERHAPMIGEALAMESGKSRADATAEAIYGVELMRYHAEWARRIEGEVIESDTPDETLMLKREPIGVVACLIPFNFSDLHTGAQDRACPDYRQCRCRAAEQHHATSAFAFAQAVLEADLPAGLVNIMTMSHDVARTMCTHPAVGMITLTGSVSAGQTVLDYCKANIAKPSLELGGKSPVIIEPDADLDVVARMVLGAKTAHCGQVCTSAERLYVHASIHDALVEKLRAGFQSRRFGDRAADPDIMGRLPMPRHVSVFMRWSSGPRRKERRLRRAAPFRMATATSIRRL